MVQHRIYAWHESKNRGITKPKNTEYNIKGMELEISDWNAGGVTDYLIDEEILTVPSNEDIKKEHTIVVESDGSVDHELIIKACGNKKLLEAVKLLESYYNDECDNEHGTSCHIHINRRYLRKRGVTETAFFKAVEFMYPILYRVSGRNFNSTEWCRSHILNDKYYGRHEEEVDLLKLAKKVDYIDEDDVEECSYNSRYYATNTQNRNTIELRIFSNYYNFNSKYIKLYIDLTDFLIDIAETMGEYKQYYYEYDNLINKIRKFFNKKNRKDIFIRHGIDIFLVPEEERKRRMYEEYKNFLKRRIDAVKNRKYGNKLEELMSIIRVFRDFNNRYDISNLDINFEVNMSDEDIAQIEEEIIERLNYEIERL